MNFSDIPVTSEPISALQQVHLQLGRPKTLGE